MFGCDGPWWSNNRGLPDYRGVKLAHDSGICATYPDVHKVEVREGCDELLFGEPGVIGWGGNSGFMALNLAAQFGARRILLIGFDMHAASGVHWYGKNTGRDMRNPEDRNFIHWRKAMNDQAPVLRRYGIEVVNGSAGSAVAAFPKMSVEDTLKKWCL